MAFTLFKIKRKKEKIYDNIKMPKSPTLGFETSQIRDKPKCEIWHNTFTMLSSPPVTIHRPSGLNLMALIPPLCPLYVQMHPFLRPSHIFRFVSKDPDAMNSPNGWKSTEMQLDLCPVRVQTTAGQENDQPWRSNTPCFSFAFHK